MAAIDVVKNGVPTKTLVGLTSATNVLSPSSSDIDDTVLQMGIDMAEASSRT